VLTSFPGLGDTATPVHGAAGAAKNGGAAASAPDGVFAALMLGATEDAPGAQPPQGPLCAQDAQVSQGAPGPPDAQVSQDGNTQDLAFMTANIARLFSSLRKPSAAPDQTAPGGKARASSDGTPAPAVRADDSTGVDRTAPIIIVAPEPASVPPTQLPQGWLGAQDAASSQEEPNLLGAPGLQGAPGLPKGAQDAQSPQRASTSPGAPAALNPHALSEALSANETQTVDVTPGAQAAPQALAAQGLPDATVAQPAKPASAPQVLQNTIVALASQGVPDAIAAPPVHQGVAATPVAPNAPPAQVALEQPPQKLDGLPSKAAITTGVVPPAQAAVVVAALGGSDSSTSEAFGYARPRPAALSVDGTDKNANAPKLKMALGTIEAAPVRAERATIVPRAMAPVPVMPHVTLASVAPTIVSLPALSAGVADSPLGAQIVQSLRMQWAQGGGEATIELNPNFLGRVQVSVRVDHGVVSASVQSDTPVVREWVAAHHDELTQTLAQQGLRLDKLEVAQVSKEQPARDGARDPRHADREASRHRRDDGTLDADTFDMQDPQEPTGETPRSVEPR